MDIENAIKDVITAKLEEGIIEKLVAENLEKGINESLKNLLGSYGDVTKIIEKKIKEVMIVQLSGYDYSKYIVKLDHVLTEILKNTALDNKKILENFKELMIEKELPKEIKVSELFDKWCEYVAKNVDCSELEVNTDDTPTYEYVDVSYKVTEDEKRSWGSLHSATIFFECEKDEDMNLEIKISKWKDKKIWDIDFKGNTEISQLRHLDDFKLYLIQLVQNRTALNIDKWSDTTEIQPEEEPEASY